MGFIVLLLTSEWYNSLMLHYETHLYLQPEYPVLGLKSVFFQWQQLFRLPPRDTLAKYVGLTSYQKSLVHRVFCCLPPAGEIKDLGRSGKWD